MIKVLKLEAQEFRGVRDLTIEFGGENFAICGRNGTGKSGIVDALEFGLTGNISRLSGKGTGDISLKDHAPHVDSRNRPDKALVKLTVRVPNIGGDVTIERSVKNPLAPIIKPNTPAIVEALQQIALHPEFVLSRRELIRYVLSTPGDRATEVQALLQLGAVEELRTLLNKIANACQRVIIPLRRARAQAHDQLLAALQIPEWSTARALAAVNAQREILALPPLSALTANISLRDGLAAAPATMPSRVPKMQAMADIKEIRGLLARLGGAEVKANRDVALKLLEPLASDPTALDSANRERFFTVALGYIEAEMCPVCDTEWDRQELRALLNRKLKRLEEIGRKRADAQKHCEGIVSLLEELGAGLRTLERYRTLLAPKTVAVTSFKEQAEHNARIVDALEPLADAVAVLKDLSVVPEDVTDCVAAVDAAVSAIPDPTAQEASRDYLTEGQVRLQAYRDAALAEKRAEDHGETTRKLYETYGAVSTGVLNDIYKKVEGQFSDLYRFINQDDEDEFTAQLTPSLGKLGFDVDFYGRGFFPPGAYHSEGHQDAMGICLYLALMRHLLGDSFTFAVLDDVLMSVDAGHRREVCRLLKEKFSGTQFILTTHDEIWLRHMKAAGLIGPKSFIHFRTWDVEHGPTEWEGRDIWEEIDAEVAGGNVRAAAGVLRHYLEFAFGEICHRLRAPVEYRGDAQHDLGDLLPAALGRLGALLREGKSAAQSWKRTAEVTAIEARETEFKSRVSATNAEQWQINPAVHYNEWGNFTPEDFRPVVTSFRALMQSFSCIEPLCLGQFYVQPEKGTRQELRCPCGATNINLRKK